MSEVRVSRRRAIAILATLAGTALSGSAAREARPFEWRGTALGADAYLSLAASDRGAAEHAVGLVLDEVERLERVFSLYRADSELVRLNRHLHLERPSLELLEVLAQSVRLHAITEGLFDPTVQPLWQRLAMARSATEAQTIASADRIAGQRAHPGMSRIDASPRAIRLEPGMGLTLNGIAQGYITDRVADLLRARGWANVLIDLGEVRALGRHPSGRAFRIEVPESDPALELTESAAATSSPDALWLSRSAGLSHILDPRDPSAPSPWRSMTVGHPSAMIADGLSTALVLADRPAVVRILARVPRARVWAIGRDGTRLTLPSAA